MPDDRLDDLPAPVRDNMPGYAQQIDGEAFDNARDPSTDPDDGRGDASRWEGRLAAVERQYAKGADGRRPARKRAPASRRHGPIAHNAPMTLLLPLLLAALLPAPGSATAPPDAAGTTFVVVRHAEKAGDGSPDPPLAPAGLQRAQRLAARLERAPLVAVYATGYRRTRQTAAPVAAAHALPVATYDPSTPAIDLAHRLRTRHPQGTVLVVGHGNTVPALVSALCGCEVDAMDETTYDRIETVRIDPHGRAGYERLRQDDAP